MVVFLAKLPFIVLSTSEHWSKNKGTFCYCISLLCFLCIIIDKSFIVWGWLLSNNWERVRIGHWCRYTSKLWSKWGYKFNAIVSTKLSPSCQVQLDVQPYSFRFGLGFNVPFYKVPFFLSLGIESINDGIFLIRKIFTYEIVFFNCIYIWPNAADPATSMWCGFRNCIPSGF